MRKQARQERVVRLLNLLAYVDTHPASTVMEMARDLGLEPEEVRDDLNMLHLSGVGKHGGQMIDLHHDWSKVDVIDNQGLDKPLRLTPTEANALLLLLESLETMPGLVDLHAVTSASAKIREVALGGIDDTVAVVPEGTAAVIAEALGREQQLDVTYYSVSSDTTSVRRVSPVDTFHRDGMTYLRAWDGEGVKSFRFDRIRAAALVDAPTEVPDAAAAAVDAEDPFGFPVANAATLQVRREATWLADYWDLELDSDALADPSAEWVPATLRFGSGDWLVRFCLGQADRVQLETPEELAAEARRRAELAIEALG